MIRWGVCCHFRKAPIKFRATTAAFLARYQRRGGDPAQFLDALALDNLRSLEAAIDYCAEHRIGCFRVSSQLFPLITHPQFGYTLDALPSASQIVALMRAVRDRACDCAIRLTTHPDQFLVLNSPNLDVVQRSVRELIAHGAMAEALGIDVINVHAGGVYGDAPKSLGRLVEQIEALPALVLSRLTLENDDRSYTPSMLAPLCLDLGVPFVYDVHHHRCLPDPWSVERASDAAYASWGQREPLFHLSSPRGGWSARNPRMHGDEIDPDDFPIHWLGYPALTVEVEAKSKEVAVFKLRKKLMNFL